MSDPTTRISELRELVQHFVDQRDWRQFHSPKNLSMALAIEAAELMEHFQWLTLEESRAVVDRPEVMQEVTEELADVLSYTLALANSLEIDLSDAVRAKMVKNGEKYPADEFRGRYGKRDQGRGE